MHALCQFREWAYFPRFYGNAHPLKLHPICRPVKFPKCGHRNTRWGQWRWPHTPLSRHLRFGSEKVGNPDIRHLAAGILAPPPTVTNEALAPQLAGSRLDRIAVHIQPLRQFIGSQAARTSRTNGRRRHSLKPPQFGSPRVCRRNRRIDIAVPGASGYALLGSTWLIWKLDGEGQAHAGKLALRAAVGTVVLTGAVSPYNIFLNAEYAERTCNRFAPIA